MRDFLKDKDEIDAYYIADPIHPRAAGIMWPVIIDRRIDQLFDFALRPDEKVRNELLRPSGALGNYGTKVQLAYLLGWMGKEIFDDLITISKIRNRFAHYIEVKDFEDQRIKAWLDNLAGSQMLPKMLETARRRAEEEVEPPPPPKASWKAYLFTLEGIAEDPTMRFRWCIDLMLRKLDEYAENMKRNLESLPESWLTGEEKPERFRTPKSSPEKS